MSVVCDKDVNYTKCVRCIQYLNSNMNENVK